MVYFREVQRFRQWWLWAVLLLSAAGAVFAMYYQLILGPGPAAKPVTDTEVLVTGLFIVAVAAWFWTLRMVTEVHEDAVEVQFVPMWRKRRLPFAEIRSAEARTYSPIIDYGGWGLRWKPGKMAYNVSGDRGVLLVLADGKSVMVGTQRPEELEAAIVGRASAQCHLVFIGRDATKTKQ